MSLFADKWPSQFDSTSLAYDSVHSDGNSRLGSRSLFDYRSGGDAMSSSTKPLGTSLISGRIFDHIDAIVHELTSSDRPSRRHNSWGSDSSRRSTLQNGPSGAEFLIPVKIKTACGDSRSSSFSSNKFQKEESKLLELEKEPKLLDRDPATSQQNRANSFIQIPIVRESYQSNPRENCYQSNPRENCYQSNPRENCYQSNPRENCYQSNPRENCYQSNSRENCYQSNPRENCYQSYPRENCCQSNPREIYQSNPRKNYQSSRYQSNPRESRYQSNPRESRYQSNPREASLCPVATDSASVPSIFTLLTTRSTDEEGGPANHTTPGYRSIFSAPLSDGFCRQPSTKPPPHRRPPTTGADSDGLDTVKIEEEIEEEETTILRRQPRHRFYQDRSAGLSASQSAAFCGARVRPRDSSTLSPTWEVSSCGNDVRYDVRPAGDKRVEREDNLDVAQGGRQKQCSSPGVTDVTPTPSYPVYDLLKPRLASTGRQVDYIRGDGNCFFRALSKEMYGTEDYHAEWREAVCDVIGDHPHVFSQYVDEGSVGKHVSDMRQLGTWATSCEIYGAATLLRRDVYVLAPASREEDAEYHWMLFSPRRLSGSSRGSGESKMNDEEGGEESRHPCYITLCHTNGNHYDRITATDGCCNCQMPAPCLNGLAVLMDTVHSHDEEEESWSS